MIDRGNPYSNADIHRAFAKEAIEKEIPFRYIGEKSKMPFVTKGPKRLK